MTLLNRKDLNMSASTIEDVKQLIVQTLGIEDASRIAGASTQLFGNLPELDSFAVVNLAMEIENRFGFEIDPDEQVGRLSVGWQQRVEQLVILERLCPNGCEELEDLRGHMKEATAQGVKN